MTAAKVACKLYGHAFKYSSQNIIEEVLHRPNAWHCVRCGMKDPSSGYCGNSYYYFNSLRYSGDDAGWRQTTNSGNIIDVKVVPILVELNDKNNPVSEEER